MFASPCISLSLMSKIMSTISPCVPFARSCSVLTFIVTIQGIPTAISTTSGSFLPFGCSDRTIACSRFVKGRGSIPLLLTKSSAGQMISGNCFCRQCSRNARLFHCVRANYPSTSWQLCVSLNNGSSVELSLSFWEIVSTFRGFLRGCFGGGREAPALPLRFFRLCVVSNKNAGLEEKMAGSRCSGGT